jgi:hypothetical protein
MVQNNQITGFVYCFWAILGNPKWTQKVHIGPQVGRLYGQMFKLENKPLTKSVMPILSVKMVQNIINNFLMLFFPILWPIGKPERYGP